MIENLTYMEFTDWYDGVYKDVHPCCGAARSFAMLHEEKPRTCWLLLHGYRGYPGEMVSPAATLFDTGFDVFVPRLPGHGTSHEDFEKCDGDQWMKLARNALHDLKTRYRYVNILGHSMGGSIAILLGCASEQTNKIVIAAPSFENRQMNFPARVILRTASIFTPRIRCKWHMSSKYHLHYENAPCDEAFLGEEYFSWFYTKRLFDYRRICRQSIKVLLDSDKECLIISPEKDQVISEPSSKLYVRKGGFRDNVFHVKDGTHCIFYDKTESAELTALDAISEFALGLNH